MIYTLVSSGSGFELGIGPSAGCLAGSGDDAVRVSSGHSPYFVTFLVGRILFDYHEACGGGCYRSIGPLRLAEVLRDFYGFEILGSGPVADGDGMTVDLGQLYGRFCIQERYLAQCMGVFDRDGLPERLAEIGRSENPEPGEGEPYILDIDGYAHIVNGKLMCFEPDLYDVNDPEHRKELFRIADALYTDKWTLPLYGKNTVYAIKYPFRGDMHLIHMPVSTQRAVRECGHKYHFGA